jgi:hypothetical protein
MGWLYQYEMTRRSDIITDRTKTWDSRTFENDAETYRVTKCLKHCYRGNSFAGILWTVRETTVYNSKTDEVIETVRWIGCDKLAYCRRDECWGYKDMEESMGPGYYSCPLSYLEMTPPYDNDWARKWREQVREYHNRRKPSFKPKVGTYVILKEGWSRRGPFFITSVNPLRGNDGRDCRIPRKALLREVTREELDRAKEEWRESIKKHVINYTQAQLDDVQDDAIRYKNDFLFASI